MANRQSYFRGIRLLLECGHETTIGTSFYRLSRERCFVIRGNYGRRGCWCAECGAPRQPTKYLGTERLGEGATIHVRGKRR